MTLRQEQSVFAQMVARLIQRAAGLGYEVTLGEAWRSPEETQRLAAAGLGSAESLHGDRLAIDLNLFKNGRYLRTTKAHKPLGKFWESIGGSWGGRWGDGNHYSKARGGRK